LTEIVNETPDAPLPDALKDRPPLGPELEEYWQGFVTLSQCRTYNFGGSNPISMSDIFAYFQAFAINRFEDREDFVYFVKRLDEEYLRMEAAKARAKK
jgi:hypothetical protein